MQLVPMSFEGEIKPLQPGTYSARIAAGEPRLNKAGTGYYINWRFETFGSPDVNGKSVFYMTPTSGGWVTKLADLHKAATGEAIDKKQSGYDPQMLIGREVMITVFERAYQAADGSEKTSLDIKAVAPLKQ